MNEVKSTFQLIKTDKVLLTPEEVMDLLGCSRATIYDWKYRGGRMGVPSGMFIKVGRRLRICAKELNAWIAAQN